MVKEFNIENYAHIKITKGDSVLMVINTSPHASGFIDVDLVKYTYKNELSGRLVLELEVKENAEI